jgi:mannose-6-phosphate isomerase-like protein (cupin superfamily)
VFSEGNSVFIPKGSVHRLANPFDLPAVLIEVQIGTYLGEDDIQRYEDLYGRTLEE